MIKLYICCLVFIIGNGSGSGHGCQISSGGDENVKYDTWMDFALATVTWHAMQERHKENDAILGCMLKYSPTIMSDQILPTGKYIV